MVRAFKTATFFLSCLLIAAALFSPLFFPFDAYSATAKIQINQPSGTLRAGGAYPISFRVTVQLPWFLHGPVKSAENPHPTSIHFSKDNSVKISSLQFPSPTEKKFPYMKAPIGVYGGQIEVKATLNIDRNVSAGEQLLKGQLVYQACSFSSCLPPETVPFSFPVPVTEPANGSTEQAIARTAAAAPVSDPATGDWNVGAGLWLTLLGIFLGGLALNLTPCIYPLIPITVSYFGGQGGRMGGIPLIHGICYILGLAITNSVLGVVAALSGGMLGAALQSPFVLMVVAAILLALALSFFGVWELRIPAGLTNMAAKNFGGYFGTLFMGLTLGIVAAPCLGPFILGLLTYVGQKGDVLLGFLYFFVLSLGMGIPLAVLAVFSGAVDKLPMSGTWMVWIRKALGWVLIGMAGYLLLPVLPDSISRLSLFSVIMAAAGLHLGWLDREGRNLRTFSNIRKVVGVVLIVASGALFWYSGPAQKHNGEEIAWKAYTPDLVKAAMEAGKAGHD